METRKPGCLLAFIVDFFLSFYKWDCLYVLHNDSNASVDMVIAVRRVFFTL